MINRINLKKPSFLIPLIECLVLSLPLLLIVCLSIGSAVKDYFNTFLMDFKFFYLPMFLIIILLVNAVFYSILKKRYNLEIDTFLYGIGLATSLNLLVYLFVFLFINGDNHLLKSNLYLWGFYTIPLTSLFYLFSIMFKNNEKKMTKPILCLTAIAAVSPAYGIIKDFEMIKQYQFVWILPILIGLLTGHYAVYRTIQFSPRSLAWTPILIILILCIGFAILSLPLRIWIYFVDIGETLIAAFLLASESFAIAYIINYFSKKRNLKNNDRKII